MNEADKFPARSATDLPSEPSSPAPSSPLLAKGEPAEEEPYWAASPYRMIGQVSVNMAVATLACWLTMGLTYFSIGCLYSISPLEKNDNFIFENPGFNADFLFNAVAFGPLVVAIQFCITSIFGLYFGWVLGLVFVFAMMSDNLAMLFQRCLALMLTTIAILAYLMFYVKLYR